jgi:RNA polymerase sigma factor for flagellar operon FliA
VTTPAERPALSAEMSALLERHLPLVRAVVASVTAHYPRHTDREELVQAGTLGLVEAAHRFDPDRGVPFEVWASRRVRGAVVDAVRARDFAPRTLRSRARAVDTVRADLEVELGRVPTSAETAERAGLSLAELVGLEGRLHRSLVLSLDAPLEEVDGEQFTLGTGIVDRGAPEPLALLERREQHGYVRDALSCLPPRLRAVVVGYFLDGQSSVELADRLGITESRISQLRSEALTLLRQGIAAQYGEQPDATSTRRVTAFAGELAKASTYRARMTALPARGAPVLRAQRTPVLPAQRTPKALAGIA